jgi:hypothetical protein
MKVIINLDEDGLNLWLAALRNTLTLSSVNGAPALFDLFPQALLLLSTNLDLLGKATNIIESYLLLDSASLLQVRRPFLTALHFKPVELGCCRGRIQRLSYGTQKPSGHGESKGYIDFLESTGPTRSIESLGGAHAYVWPLRTYTDNTHRRRGTYLPCFCV